MVNFPTWIPDYGFHSPALLDLFISSKTNICSRMAFSLLGNSDVLSQFPMTFHQIHKRMQFHSIAYDCSCADWDSLHDHLRDVPCKDIFKLSASAAASEFCEWVQVGIDVYIPHQKYQAKPLISMVFS